MRKLHAVAALAFLLIVALACKRGAEPASSDAAATSTPSVMSAADPASTTASAPANWKVGDTLDVEWSGTWYEAQILAVLAGPQYKIHYVGWGNNYDEAVGPSRMRARAGAASSATASATTSSSAHVATADATDHFSSCHGADGWAGAPYNTCIRDCTTETDCTKPCLGDWVISSCATECAGGMNCVQVQHQMQDGVGYSKACVGKMGKGCSHAVTGGGCKAGWSKPTTQDDCMQECPNGSGARESCPAGFICTSARTWMSPHCVKH